MKRFILYFSILSLTILVLSACHTDSNNDSDVGESLKNPTSTEFIDKTYYNFFASYYRISWQEEWDENIIIIRSVDELRDYAKQIDLLARERLRKEVLDNSIKYSDDFFSNHSLIVVFASEGSGSVRHNVTSVTDDDKVLQICIDRHSPELVTWDMASWLIFIETEEIPIGLEPKIVWNHVTLDSIALSPPASALKNVALESLQETDKLYAVFQFSGIHSRLYPGIIDTLKMTKDGNEMNFSDYGIWGDEYEYYKRVIENGETTFYIPISIYPEVSVGAYVFSGEYQGKTFCTEPLDIAY